MAIMFRFCSLQREFWLLREDAFEGLRSGCRESSLEVLAEVQVRWLKPGAVTKVGLKVSWVSAALSLCEGQVEEVLAKALEIVVGILLQDSDRNELCTSFKEEFDTIYPRPYLSLFSLIP